MANKCDFCIEKCPQAERAHQAALGRMYATNEFIALQKKVESGEFVKVVRCKGCKHSHYLSGAKKYACRHPLYTGGNKHGGEHFCSYGERREGE